MTCERFRGFQKNVGFCRGAFTLIELLVVIAIIALLLAILLPSLESARCNAKRNACAAHIKNIATSSRVYEADDEQGWGIPVHPRQFFQNATDPTYIGAYEWGGKSGIGTPMAELGPTSGPSAWQNSKFGTKAGYGPATRPMNEILYPAGFKDNLLPTWDRIGAENDTKLNLDIFRCPGDIRPPRGAHCPDWVNNPERSSFDHFGNSYAANIFMIARTDTPVMYSNSPYLRPITRIPTPARTLYYEENIGRWAWACRREACTDIPTVFPGINPGPTKSLPGWHCADWKFNRAFVDGHGEYQKVYFDGTEDNQGYALHYYKEHLDTYPPFPDSEPSYDFYECIIVRGPNWAKDTLPAAVIPTGLTHPEGGRPSYEDCVEADN